MADAMKDEDDGWFHNLRSENIAVPVTEGGDYVCNGSTEEEYERCVG